MNSLKLKDYLTNNADDILKILESLDFQKITYAPNRKEFRFARDYGKNPSATVLYTSSLMFKCYSEDETGDIYTLVMDKKRCGFPEALRYIVKLLDIDSDIIAGNVRLPFGGFYKKLLHDSYDSEMFLKTYDPEILKPYANKYSKLFFDDGIDYKTQELYGIGYDSISSRITIPEYTFDGELCGIMGRLNETDCDKEKRWLPIIPCSRNCTLYGYHMNYKNILDRQICVIGESEKFVMQLHSMGYDYGLASCTNSLSKTQAKYIKKMLIPKIVIAYDEGVEEDKVIFQAEKLLSDTPMYKNRVGYIWDADHTVIPKDSKGSPSDYGKKGFKYLAKHCVRWLKS